MLKVYGSKMCEDTMECVHTLEEKNIEFEFVEIEASLDNLKAFLKIRDNSPLYEKVRENGGIGIPYVEKADGEGTLDWKTVL